MEAQAHFFNIGSHHLSIAVYGFNMQSAVVGFVQSTKPGSGSIEEKIISLSASFSILAFAASVDLPPRYTTILCRISFFFSLLACSFLLSPFAPHALFWVPHLASVFPLLHLLQLLPAPLRQSLQQPWLSAWNAVRHAACRVHEALLPISSSTTSNAVPEISNPSSSSAAPEHSMEEGDADAVNGKCSLEQGSFKRSRGQFVSGSTVRSTGSIIIMFGQKLNDDILSFGQIPDCT